MRRSKCVLERTGINYVVNIQDILGTRNSEPKYAYLEMIIATARNFEL